VLDRLSTIAALIIAAAVALCLGLAMTAGVLASRYAPGTSRSGEWEFWPRAGVPDADPYSLAIHVRRGDLPMAPEEGLTLFATHDMSGAQLNGRCTYNMMGTLPSVRAWTLAAYTPKGALIRTDIAPSALNSSTVATLPGLPIASLSPDTMAGNWLATPRDQAFVVVLRLYDTSLTVSAQGLDSARLPRFIRKGCT
jgi:hypothetical protein